MTDALNARQQNRRQVSRHHQRLTASQRGSGDAVLLIRAEHVHNLQLCRTSIFSLVISQCT
jgi:hypothetical protein